MSERLPTDLLVRAMLRRVNDAGGSAMVLARGDAQAGGVLVVTAERGESVRCWERGIGPNGRTTLIESTPASGEVEDYWRRRRQRDPDLWVVELDIAAAERFAAETIASN